MVSSDIYTNKLKVSTDTITVPVFKSNEILSTIPQQDKINVFSNINYISSPNAVKLLPFITNNNGKVRLYTEVNSNIKVGDKVFIMWNPSGTTTGNTDAYIMDSFLEFVSPPGFDPCDEFIYLPQMQGYNVIEIGDDNNEITIDRYYDQRFVNKRLYDHYIAEIYMRNVEVTGGEFDGVAILKGDFNTGQDLAVDINLVQAIVLSGTSYYIRYKNKYDSQYISTNSSSNTGVTLSTYKPYIYQGIQTLNQDPTPVSSYFSYNNNTYGYNYVYYNKIRNSEINIGYYYSCTFIDCNISGGYFTNCAISGCTIKGGVFYNSPLDQNCTWLYGTWSGGTFPLSVWYDGIWNGGVFGPGKDWRNGIFNDGSFSGSTWRNGYFQNGSMWGSNWSGGTFGGGYIEKSEWIGGTFNNGYMTSCNWRSGTCNGGNLLNVNWTEGTFNGGIMNTSNWLNGICNGGTLINTGWNNGIFNGGAYKTSYIIPSLSGGTYASTVAPSLYTPDPNYINYTNIYLSGKYWRNGTFNGGTFSNAMWSGGTFNDGTFENNSLWLGGTFFYGTFNESSWVEGDFKNGIVNRSYFHNVNWKNGIWNGGTLGVILSGTTPTINWYNGIFNGGVFGYGVNTYLSNYVNWYNGHFYNGYFYNEIDTDGGGNLICSSSYGGFSGGTFHDGYFYGTFWKGIWVNGTFAGCNMAGILTEKTVKTKIPKNINKKFGELPLKLKQQGIANAGNNIL